VNDQSKLSDNVSGSLKSEEIVGHCSKQVKKNQVDIFLLESEKEDRECDYWIGLYRKGITRPKDLMQRSRISEIMSTAATVGLDANGPVVVADTDISNRVFYFMNVDRVCDCHAEWVRSLSSNLVLWKKDILGIYLAPEILENQSMLILCQVATEVLEKQLASKLYFFIGEHGLYPVLNAALAVKKSFEENSNLNIKIYH